MSRHHDYMNNLMNPFQTELVEPPMLTSSDVEADILLEDIVINDEDLKPHIHFGYGSCKTFLCFCGGFTPDSKKKGYCTCGHHATNHNRA
jgi:hypothetical protein